MNEQTEDKKFTTQELEDLKSILKEQIKAELKAEEENKHEEFKKLREEEAKKYTEYVEQMQKSKEPWVDIKGWYEDPTAGVKVELDWNTEFINYLKENNFSGTTEDEIVQKWLVMLLKDMSERIQDNKGDYE